MYLNCTIQSPTVFSNTTLPKQLEVLFHLSYPMHIKAHMYTFLSFLNISGTCTKAYKLSAAPPNSVIHLVSRLDLGTGLQVALLLDLILKLSLDSKKKVDSPITVQIHNFEHKVQMPPRIN